MWATIREAARAGKWLALLFGAILLVGSVTGYMRERSARHAAEIKTAQLLVLNDSTQARLATLTTTNKKLFALKEAAVAMDGTVVAGVKIRVKRDTIYVPTQPAATTYASDTTRRALLTDSANGYGIQIEAEAPRTGPLQLGYQITTPEFTPEVGFVRKGEEYYAVVSWAGQTVTTDEAFFRPNRERPLALVAGVEAYNTKGSPHGIAYSALRYRLTPNLQMQLRAAVVGLRPAIGVQVERRVW